MADEIDKANDLQAEHMAMTLALHASAKRDTRQPLGYCQNPVCGDVMPKGDNRLFCDGKCATEAGRIEQQQRV